MRYEPTFADIVQDDDKQVFKTGFDAVNHMLNWQTGRLYIFSGYPNHGKSEFVNFLALVAAKKYGWWIGCFTPENYPEKNFYRSLMHTYKGKRYHEQTEEEKQDAFEFVDKHFKVLTYADDIPSLIDVLDDWEKVPLDICKMLIIDPLNYLIDDTDTIMSERYKLMYSRLKAFAANHDKIVVIVDHPKTPYRDKGAIPVPTVFDLYGGSMANNKGDVITMVSRPGLLAKERDWQDTEVLIQVNKVKDQRIMGRPGQASIHYNWKTGRYQSNVPI
jgi:twinkle protein